MPSKKTNQNKQFKQNKTFKEKVKFEFNSYKPLLIKTIENNISKYQNNYFEKYKNKDKNNYNLYKNLLENENNLDLYLINNLTKSIENNIYKLISNDIIKIEKNIKYIKITNVEKKMLFKSLDNRNKERSLNKYENKISIYKKFQFNKQQVEETNLKTRNILKDVKSEKLKFIELEKLLENKEKNRLFKLKDNFNNDFKEKVKIIRKKKIEKALKILEIRKKKEIENIDLIEDYKKKYLNKNYDNFKSEKQFIQNEKKYYKNIINSYKLENNKYIISNIFKEANSKTEFKNNCKSELLIHRVDKYVIEKRKKLEKIKNFDKKVREINLNKNDENENDEDEESDNDYKIKISNEYTKKMKKKIERNKKIKEKIEENMKNKYKYLKEGNQYAKEINIKKPKSNNSTNNINKNTKNNNKKIDYLPEIKNNLKENNNLFDIKKLKTLENKDLFDKLTEIELITHLKENKLKYIPIEKLEEYEKKIDQEYLNLINLKLEVINNN